MATKYITIIINMIMIIINKAPSRITKEQSKALPVEQNISKKSIWKMS